MTSPDGGTLLALDDIKVKLSGLQILDGVSIEVPQGKVTGLIGPNGAGKTTVFNVISGFVKSDSGSVVYRGRALKHIKAHIHVPPDGDQSPSNPSANTKA